VMAGAAASPELQNARVASASTFGLDRALTFETALLSIVIWCRFVLGVPEPTMNSTSDNVIRQSCWCGGMLPASEPRILSVVSQVGMTSRYVERQ
jgi:hypothetical protein